MVEGDVVGGDAGIAVESICTDCVKLDDAQIPVGPLG
jgi:hypothetical protein